MNDAEKKKFLTLPGLESDPSVVLPVASRYTDYAIPVPLRESVQFNIFFICSAKPIASK
jgi:hypothetical protein